MQPSRVFNPGLFRYRVGDATLPQGGGHRMIIHCCNSIGAWGAGFVMSLSKRWKKPEEQYKLWYRSQVLDRVPFKLGEIQIVDVNSDLSVVNMIAQDGIGFKKNEQGELIPPVRYDALESCLKKVAKEAKDRKSSIHAPRICCGLAGGRWNKVEPLLVTNLINQSISVNIYDFSPFEEKEEDE